METVVWLASSLPGNFLGGLGAIGGAAMQTTAALAGGAAAVGNAFVGTATGIVGGATKTVTTDIAHVLSGVPNVAGHATSLATAGLHEATALTAGATQVAAGGLSIVKDGSTAVAENIAHLVSGEHVIAPGNLIPNITKDAVGATQAAAGSVAKVANALEGINPLHLNIGPKESQAAQVRLTSVVSTVTLLMGLEFCAATAESFRKSASSEVTRILIRSVHGLSPIKHDCYRT